MSKKVCKTVSDKECGTSYKQQCKTVQEKVCREPDLEIVQLPPTDGYGVPQVRYMLVIRHK